MFTFGVFLILTVVLFVIARALLWLLTRVGSRGGNGNGNGVRAFGPLTGFFASMLPALWFNISRLDRDLSRAGYYSPYARINYLAMRNVVLLIWGLFIAAMLFLVAQPGSQTIGVIAAVGIIGAILIYGLPRLYVGMRGDQRVAEIQAGLPDALDVITMAVTGGLPLHGAIDAVRDEIRTTHPALGCEFDIIRRHAETSSLDQAFEKFAERVDDPPVRTLAAIVSQSERLGANVASSLREYADGARRASRQQAEERATKTSVKLLFPVALCLAPPTYILLLGPAFLELRSFVQQQTRTGGALSQPDPSQLNDLSGSEQSQAQLRELQNELRKAQQANRDFRRQQAAPANGANRSANTPGASP
jgi:tight adherence protein C